jgi:hypothetical protein
MKEITLENKLSILKKALLLLSQYPKYKFICEVCSDANDYLGIVDIWSYSDTFKLIPELLKYKPKKPWSDICWFPATTTKGNKQRIKVIEKTIMDLKNNLK